MLKKFKQFLRQLKKIKTIWFLFYMYDYFITIIMKKINVLTKKTTQIK